MVGVTSIRRVAVSRTMRAAAAALSGRPPAMAAAMGSTAPTSVPLGTPKAKATNNFDVEAGTPCLMTSRAATVVSGVMTPASLYTTPGAAAAAAADDDVKDNMPGARRVKVSTHAASSLDDGLVSTRMSAEIPPLGGAAAAAAMRTNPPNGSVTAVGSPGSAMELPLRSIKTRQLARYPSTARPMSTGGGGGG